MMIEFGGDDPERRFSLAEQEQLTRILLRLTEEINSSDKNTKYDRRFVQNLHFQLFSGVRDHAGRFREKGFGEEYLTFGPNRSASAEEVPERLELHFAEAARLFDQLDMLAQNLQFIEEVIKVAAFVHADLIRIHPFRDGNGRVSRLVMNLILRRYGFPLHTMNIPKQEYFDALNHFYETREIGPLCELLIRAYYDQLEV